MAGRSPFFKKFEFSKKQKFEGHAAKVMFKSNVK